MAGNKKPRKAHTKKRIDVPMMRDSIDAIAFKMRAACEVLVAAPGAESLDEMFRLGLILVLAVDALSSTPIKDRTDPPSRAIVKGMAALEALDERFDRDGAVVLDPAEVSALRDSIATLDFHLARIPFSVYQAAAMFESRAREAMKRARMAASIEEARKLLAQDEASAMLAGSGVLSIVEAGLVDSPAV
jgi:hypothetical protein